jgi:Flp pilus assembly protein TadG
MITALRRLFGCRDAAVAVEFAILIPIFLALTLGITDLGTGMFVRLTANAAAQSGAAYAVINSGSVCTSLDATCLAGIKDAMNDATGNASFCTDSVCTASFTACADPNGGVCFIVSANYPFTPILPDAVYAWAQAMTVNSTVTIRVQ